MAAIKLISKNNLTEKDAELIKTELDIMKFLKNSHNTTIVKLIDICEDDQNVYIAMEYLSGGDLQSYLNDRNDFLGEEEIKEIMRQIVDGVAYLHKFGILHRDLKPENMLLVKKTTSKIPKIKIMDFGLSKVIGTYEKTKEGYGSLCYSSPEILTKKPYDHKIDIWSIGVILYFLLSGTFPFDDVEDDIYKIAKKITGEEVVFHSRYFSKHSKKVRELISKCLSKSPVTRVNIKEVTNDEWFKY